MQFNDDDDDDDDDDRLYVGLMSLQANKGGVFFFYFIQIHNQFKKFTK